MRLRSTSLAVLLTACHPLAHGDMASSGALPIEQPLAPPVAEFDTRSEPNPVRGSTDARAELTRMVRDLSADHALAGDGRLAELALALSRKLSAEAAAFTGSELAALASERGLVNSLPQVQWVIGGDLTQIHASMVLQATPTLAEFESTHYGIAASRQGPQWSCVLVVERRAVTLAPIPRALPEAGEVRVEAALSAPLVSPTLYVTRPDGKTERVLRVEGGTKLVHTLSLADGAWGIELMAESARGPTVVANMTVVVGAPAVSAATTTSGPVPRSTEEFTAQLEQLIAGERARYALPPVTRDAALDGVALGHSVDMRDHSFVGHVSPSAGTLEERITRAGVATWTLRENVARSYSPAEAHASLMASPAHRSAVLAADPDRLGLGVAARDEGGRDVYLVTELFARTPHALDPARALAESAQRIHAARAERGLKPVITDATLSRAASNAAKTFFDAGIADRRAALQLAVQRTQMPRGASTLKATMSSGALPDSFTIGDELLDPGLRWVGIGFAQGIQPSSGLEGVAMVLFLAK